MSTTHGMANTPEYHAWESMKLRCSARYWQYPRHAQRGTKVCERWANSFEAFYTDVGPRPSPDHSLDRIDNDGDYEPGNVRWATRSEQQRNTHRTSLLTINGVTRPMLEWDEMAGLRLGTVKQRLRRGWPIEEVLRPRDPVRIAAGIKGRNTRHNAA
jgi:hypothetical protein